MAKELKELLDMGIVEHSQSPYSSCLLPVSKKDGSLRLCFDYRKLNTVTLLQQKPMSNPECLFAKVAEAEIFSSRIDLSREYWQVMLEEKPKQYTAFLKLSWSTEHCLATVRVIKITKYL